MTLRLPFGLVLMNETAETAVRTDAYLSGMKAADRQPVAPERARPAAAAPRQRGHLRLVSS